MLLLAQFIIIVSCSVVVASLLIALLTLTLTLATKRLPIIPFWKVGIPDLSILPNQEIPITILQCRTAVATTTTNENLGCGFFVSGRSKF